MANARNILLALAALAWLTGAGAAGAAAEPLRVAVTIKPLHALIGAVMEGVGAPGLIVTGAGSPHAYALKPSEARALGRADVVFWIGPSMETFLDGPLRNLRDGVRLVAVLPGGGGHDHGGTDPHIWLDPAAAAAIATTAARELGAADPAGAPRYKANADALAARLARLSGDMHALLDPVRGRPLVVFHDAYGHLAEAFGLNIVGAVTLQPGRAPGARRIAEIKALLVSSGAKCLFREPQFEPALIRTVAEGLDGMTIGVLDPLGAAYDPGPEMYFRMMMENARQLAACLGR